MKRFIVFLLISIFSVALTVVLAVGGFMTASEVTSVTLVVGEGLSKRTESALSNRDFPDVNNYFTREFILDDDIDELKKVYSRFRISGYNYKYNVEDTFLWPWELETEVIFTERVSNIDGYLPESAMTEEEKALDSTITPPQWENAQWRVLLRKEAGSWKIDKLERIALITPSANAGQPATPTPTLTPAPTPTYAPTPTPTPTPALPKGEVVISTGVLNVRSGPSGDHPVIDSLADGEIITLLGEENGWYRITLGTRTGYVSGNYIRLITE